MTLLLAPSSLTPHPTLSRLCRDYDTVTFKNKTAGGSGIFSAPFIPWSEAKLRAIIKEFPKPRDGPQESSEEFSPYRGPGSQTARSTSAVHLLEGQGPPKGKPRQDDVT